MKHFTFQDLQNTPSRKHKVPQEEEFRCRARAVAFILRCGHQLKLKYTTMCSAAIYFHIFYFRRSLKVHDKYDVATSCLYFASKCEEDRKRLIEVVETSYYFKFYKKLPNPKANNKAKLLLQEECSKIIKKELLLLQTLEFNFDVEQPFDYLPLILNHWKHNKKYFQSKGKQKQLQILQFYFKIAWFFVYDAIKMVNIVMNATEHITIACVELSVRYVHNAFYQQKNNMKHKDAEVKNGHDFNFETLDKKYNILPSQVFEDETCLLALPSHWFKDFDELLSGDLVNKLCDAIIDICDLEKDKRDNKSAMKVDRNPMYIDKTLLKQPRKYQSKHK